MTLMTGDEKHSAAATSTLDVLRVLYERVLQIDPERVRVNAICPGTVDTPIVSQVAEMFPDDLDPRVADRLMMMLPGKAIAPAEIGSAIVYLASREARMITGAVLAFDGGM